MFAEIELLDGARFQGRELAHRSSRADDVEPRPRWTELELWEHANGSFVLETRGHSDYRGETTRVRVSYCVDSETLIRALTLQSGLPSLAIDLLIDASEVCDRIEVPFY